MGNLAIRSGNMFGLRQPRQQQGIAPIQIRPTLTVTNISPTGGTPTEGTLQPVDVTITYSSNFTTTVQAQVIITNALSKIATGELLPGRDVYFYLIPLGTLNLVAPSGTIVKRIQMKILKSGQTGVQQHNGLQLSTFDTFQGLWTLTNRLSLWNWNLQLPGAQGAPPQPAPPQPGAVQQPASLFPLLRSVLNPQR